ncbi:MAG: RIP metalloprotease RseP [Gammaproteobacteria bacterium]|nr:MAG: RIP metalloprotease RseP [Gammaproteobacteria bacterium]
MMSALTNLVAFIVAISILVAVHEFGHYIVGRLCGIKVLRFSIGFGKPVWMKIAGRDRTEYCISAIPLGGYVKFLDEREGPIDPEDQGRAFNHKPIASRIAVLLAGPFFNFLFAFLAYWVLFINGVPTMKPAVGEVTEGSYAAEAGLEFGDRILKVGDRNATDWETALVSMLDEMLDDGRVPLELKGADGWVRKTTIDVGDDASRLTEPGMLFDGLGFQPWQPPAIVGNVAEDGAAHAAGIEEGDRITAIDGESVVTFRDLQQIVRARPHETVTVELIRRNAGLSREVTLGSQELDGVVTGLLGVGISTASADYWYVRKYAPFPAIGQAIGRSWTSIAFTVRMLSRMLTGEVSIKNISGPINIAQYAGNSAAAGIIAFLNFLALISISLGVLNLLPIPILDGGQIVYQAIEGLKGSPLSEKAQLFGQKIGILALLLLMSFAFYNDIARIIE